MHLAVFLCLSCVNNQGPKIEAPMGNDNDELRGILHASPTTDANEAVRRNDLRFLAIKGYAVTVPGVEDYDERFSLRYGYRIIEGTTDAIRSDQDRRIQEAAVAYATAYNRVIREYVLERK